MLLTNDLTAAVVDEALHEGAKFIICYRKSTLLDFMKDLDGLLSLMQTLSSSDLSSPSPQMTRCKHSSCDSSPLESLCTAHTLPSTPRLAV